MDKSDLLTLNIKIISTRRLNIPDKLEKMRHDTNKKYIFYNSSVTTFHQFVYANTKIPKVLFGMNLPIIINNELITPKKYNLVQKLDTTKILKLEFLEPDSPYLQKYQNTILGAIKVYLRK